MRITNNTMTSKYLNSVQSSLQRIDKLTTQINTQQEINKVSDDPYKAIKIMNLKNDIKDVERYNANCDEAVGWLNTIDSSLESVGTLAGDIKVLLSSISGTLSNNEVKNILKDINGKVEEIGNALNSEYTGNYILSGSATDEPPILINKDANGVVTLSINPAINKDKMGVELSGGVVYDYSMDIESALGKGGLDILNNISSLLNKPDMVMGGVLDSINAIDGFINDNLSNRVLIGSKVNTVEALKSSNSDGLESLSETYSLLQDVDIVEKYVELSTANYVYQSTMQVGAKILQPTLLDYLR